MQTPEAAGPLPCDPPEAVIQSAGMKKAAVLALLVACLAGAGRTGQTPAADARLIGSYIPATAGPWLSEADQVYDAASIPGDLGRLAELVRSHHLEVLVARRFIKDGQPDILVDAFDMGAPGEASGVFALARKGRAAGLGHGSAYQDGLLSFWKDRYFVTVSTERETEQTKSLILGLGQAIAAAIPEGRTK